MSRGGMCVCVCACVSRRCWDVLGDLLPWPIKRGFVFDSALKETDEPAELKYFLLSCRFLFPAVLLSSSQRCLLSFTKC